MTNGIKINKTLKISWVVITPENIRELAEKIYDEYRQDLEKKPHADIRFILRGSDGTQYESENKDIFSKGGLLDNRRIISIEMNYINYTLNKKIYIILKHTFSDLFSDNRVDISGYDEIWVNGLIKLLESNVSNWKQQENGQINTNGL